MQVKNRAPAPSDYSRAAAARSEGPTDEGDFQATEPAHYGSEELAEFRQAKRKEFEDAIRYERTRMGTWVKYAHFEEQQGDFGRAGRSSARLISPTRTRTSGSSTPKWKCANL